MTSRHDHEKKQFRRLFRNQGVDEFDRRFQVLEAFLKTEQHVTCRELVDKLAGEGHGIGVGFVAETMELLCQFGFAHRVKFDDDVPRYEHRHLGLHHDHMVCTKCGSIIEFRDEELERIQEKLAEAYGFHMLQHSMEIYGICAECLKKRSSRIPLSKARAGEFLEIAGIEGGKNAQMRLTSMGLRTGDTLEVVSTQIGGQLVVSVGDSRFVLGQGLAEKILVKRAEKPFRPGIDEPRQNLPSGPPASETMLLSQMKEGQEGVIARVSGESHLRRRILEMGINRGTTVYVEKYAPLRDPIELIVKGYHVSMRVEEAAHVSVEKVRTVRGR